MTGPDDGFLSRWSRLKEAARKKDDSPPVTVVDPRQAGEPAELAATEGERQGPEDEVPLADLPPVDSIDANTDLTQWLRRKVPEEWRRAALRRLWAADPAIRDFIGPADYAWDWNTPGGAPGYGPLRATDDVAALLAQATGAGAPQETAAPPPGTQGVERPQTHSRAQESPEAPLAATHADGGVPPPAHAPRKEKRRNRDNFSSDPADQCDNGPAHDDAMTAGSESKFDVAPQQARPGANDTVSAAPPSRRRGGSAMPR